AASDPEQAAEHAGRGADPEELEPAVPRHAGHTRGVSVHAPASELLSALIDDPAHSAILLDVDGTLAPIVRHADDALVPAPTRSLLSAIAKRYALVACISGRRATDTRRIVSIGSIAYVGNHGGEVLPPSGSEVRVDPELRAWTRRVQSFARGADTPELRRLRVRLEDKGPILAFPWRGVRAGGHRRGQPREPPRHDADRRVHRLVGGGERLRRVAGTPGGDLAPDRPPARRRTDLGRAPRGLSGPRAPQPPVAAPRLHARGRGAGARGSADPRHRHRLHHHLGARLAAPGEGGHGDRGPRRRALLR